jgi:hypothetical protein
MNREAICRVIIIGVEYSLGIPEEIRDTLEKRKNKPQARDYWTPYQLIFSFAQRACATHAI